MDFNQISRPSPSTQAASAGTPASVPKFTPPAEKLLPSPNGNSWGALIGIIIVIIVLIVGVLYFWGAQLEKQEMREGAEAAISGAETQSAQTQ